MKTTTRGEDEAFAKAIFGETLEQVGEYIAQNFGPEEIFDRQELVTWALDNGFVEKGEDE